MAYELYMNATRQKIALLMQLQATEEKRDLQDMQRDLRMEDQMNVR